VQLVCPVPLHSRLYYRRNGAAGGNFRANLNLDLGLQARENAHPLPPSVVQCAHHVCNRTGCVCGVRRLTE